MGRHSRARPVMIVAAIALSMSACASGPAVTLEQAQAAIDLGYLPPELSASTNIAARDCLKKKGYSIPFSSNVQPRMSDVLVGIPGIFKSRETARVGGYSSTTSTGNPIVKFQMALPEAKQEKFQLDMYGDPAAGTLTLPSGAIQNTTGCRAEALTRVYGSLKDGVEIISFQNLLHEQSSKLGAARIAAVQEALPDYLACMEHAGYKLPKRTIGAEGLAETQFGTYREEGELPNLEEQRLAATDFDCQTESKVREKLVDVFAKNSGAWIIEHESEIQGMNEKVAESMVRAREIIAGR